jgi:uncharacterized protein Yka (UPF0111/DUF47 family)
MSAIRRLLAATVLNAISDVAAAVKHDTWRMLHMTRAKISHYQRRGDQIRTPLRI